MRSNPDRIAWRVLLTSFAILVIVCAAIAYVGQWYVFQSNVDMDIELVAARGTVRIRQPGTDEPIAVTDRRSDLAPGLEIRTDTSQATLTFSDPRDGQPIATVVMFHDGQISLDRAAAPRFAVNKGGYTIELTNESGDVEVIVFNHSERDVNVSVIASYAIADSSGETHYRIAAAASRTTISAQEAGVVVTNRLTQHQLALQPGFEASIERSAQLEATPSADHLLSHGEFDEEYSDSWRVYDDSDGHQGSVAEVDFQQRQPLSIDRSQSKWPDISLSHGETGLRQLINQNVRDLDYLELRSTFYIDEQTLSTCGTQGSECPMMIRMEYVDVQGVEREFIQGFYAFHDASLNYPLTCDSCRAEHERINLRSWYTYESGNLLTNLPPEQRPAMIRQIRIYASGHGYRTYVTEVELLASPSDTESDDQASTQNPVVLTSLSQIARQ